MTNRPSDPPREKHARLLLGYGNTLRRDDGAGVRAAEELSRLVPGADLVLRQELQLDLAVTIAQYEEVFFLKAAATGDREVRAVPVTPDPSILNTGSHTCSPGALVALCRSLYGRSPSRATLVTIPGETFDFGETLSAFTREKVAGAVALVRSMIAD